MLNIDQARAGDAPAPKKPLKDVFETEEKSTKLTIPEGWSTAKETPRHAAS